MCLSFRLPEHAERVALSRLGQASGFGLSLLQQVLGGEPGVGSKPFGVLSSRAPLTLGLGHGLRAPSGGVGGSAVTHSFGGIAGCLEDRSHLDPNRGELRLEITLGELPQPTRQTIALGDEIGHLLSDRGKKVLDLAGIKAPKSGAKAPAGDLIRRQLFHQGFKITGQVSFRSPRPNPLFASGLADKNRHRLARASSTSSSVATGINSIPSRGAVRASS